MRGFILAAGFGTRLKPLSDHLPKALVSFAGTPLLQHAITFMRSAGVKTIGINAHYLPERITDFVHEYAPHCSVFTETPKIRGTGGALDFARRFLYNEDTFMVANADIVTRFNIKKHIAAFESSGDLCRLIGWQSATTGTISFNRDSKQFTGTVKKGSSCNPGDATADFFGIALYRKEFLSLITADDFSIVPVWERAVKCGIPVTVALEETGFWRDLGTPAALAQAHFDLLDGTLSIEVAPHCVIDRAKKSCFPSSWTDTTAVACGAHCWIEDPQFTLHPEMSEIIVLPHAAKGIIKVRRGSLYTQWGEIFFHG